MTITFPTGRADWLLNHETNITFEQVLWMSEEEFRQWILDLRKAVLYSWDVLGIPPRVGYTESEIIDQFQKMATDPIDFLCTDELTGEANVIKNNSRLGTACSSWFPTMMKTKINYDAKLEGKSIYDHFADDALLDKVILYARRHFKRDSFYAYSRPIRTDQAASPDAWAWLQHWKRDPITGQDFWIAEVKDKEYSGYNPDLHGVRYLTLSGPALAKAYVTGLIEDRHVTNVKTAVVEAAGDMTRQFQIRVFDLGQKLFPVGWKAFRVSWCQVAVNFPPLTARFLYERYLPDVSPVDEPFIVYDFSAGWGGRILGAMASKRRIHYVGTDPNTDHVLDMYTPDTGKRSCLTKYHALANFFNLHVRNSLFDDDDGNTYDIFQEGSETIGDHPDFQQYIGKVDLAFSSPPYFGKEAYSQDETQSYKKFPSYEGWRDNFLKVTLATAARALHGVGTLLVNIADVKFGPAMLPLERDTIDICESLGLRHVETLHMALGSMPGANRLEADGEESVIAEDLFGETEVTEMTYVAKAKNFAKVNGRIIKTEPIFVFRKKYST